MAKRVPPDLLPGTLDMLIPRLLASGEAMHGYGLAQRLKALSNDVLQVGESSLYPALQRLVLNGYVDAEWAPSENNRRARYCIRMALGARASEVVWHVLRSTQAPVLAGTVIGVGIAVAAAPLLGAYLYGLSPYDPVAYLQVAVILGVAGALATWIPARRATRVNPAEVLRAE